MKQGFTLTPHALERLEERTSVSPENIDNLMARAIDMSYPINADRGVKMFWSELDDRAYLAFYNRITLEIVTIYEAYKWIDTTFRGKVYAHLDIFGRPLGGVSKVRRSDVNYCLRMAGLPSRKEFESIPAKNHPPGTNAKYSLECAARFEFIDHEQGTKVIRVKKLPFGTSPEQVSLEELIEALHEAMSRRNIDIDRVKCVVLELREPKRKQRLVGAPIEEIELDQRTLRDTRPAPSENLAT